MLLSCNEFKKKMLVKVAYVLLCIQKQNEFELQITDFRIPNSRKFPHSGRSKILEDI